jgi:hypothetical protein
VEGEHLEVEGYRQMEEGDPEAEEGDQEPQGDQEAADEEAHAEAAEEEPDWVGLYEDPADYDAQRWTPVPPELFVERNTDEKFERPCRGVLMTVARGMAYQKGSSGNSKGSGLRFGKRRHNTYPGSRPSSPEVKPLRPALVFTISTRWLQCSLSCVV